MGFTREQIVREFAPVFDRFDFGEPGAGEAEEQRIEVQFAS
jgi:hypothetical protein